MTLAGLVFIFQVNLKHIYILSENKEIYSFFNATQQQQNKKSKVKI